MTTATMTSHRCAYCGHDRDLRPSSLDPAAMACVNAEACELRIHRRDHTRFASPECRRCEWSPLPLRNVGSLVGFGALAVLRAELLAAGWTAESPLTLDSEAEYLYRLEQES